MKTELGDKVKGFLLKKLGKNLRKLIVGELQVGTFGALSAANTSVRNSLTAHHIPSHAYMENLISTGLLGRTLYNRNDGLCVLVESASNIGNRTLRHNRTKTYLSNMTRSERSSYYLLSPKQALEFDIDDLRNIYKIDGVYDIRVENALQDLIKQTKNKYKPLFD